MAIGVKKHDTNLWNRKGFLDFFGAAKRGIGFE